MIDLDRIQEKGHTFRVVLKNTKEISQIDIDSLAEWGYMFRQYNICKEKKLEAVTKNVCSVLNSILYQRRVVFVLTRESVKNIVSSDKNWKTRVGFRNENYRKIIGLLCKNNIIEEIVFPENKSKKTMVFKVIEPFFLSLLQVDAEKQMSEVLFFIDRKSKENNKTEKDHKTIEGLTMKERIKERMNKTLKEEFENERKK